MHVHASAHVFRMAGAKATEFVCLQQARIHSIVSFFFFCLALFFFCFFGLELLTLGLEKVLKKS